MLWSGGVDTGQPNHNDIHGFVQSFELKVEKRWKGPFAGLVNVWRRENRIYLLGFGKGLECCNYTCADFLLQFEEYKEIG